MNSEFSSVSTANVNMKDAQVFRIRFVTNQKKIHRVASLFLFFGKENGITCKKIPENCTLYWNNQSLFYSG